MSKLQRSKERRNNVAARVGKLLALEIAKLTFVFDE